jgi:O-methyltransferase
VEAVRHIERHNIPGEIVECGVWRGGSMQAIALTLMEQGNTSRELHLYDTFTGMSEPTEDDFSVRGGEVRSAADMLASSDKDARVWAVAGIDVVREGMETTGYPTERIHYHPGMVEETIPSEAPERIALLRLDTDWYASTRHELEHLWDRLSPGGMLLIDDYGDWEGARKAVDEWLQKSGLVLFLAPMGPGRVAMKPFHS